MTPERSLRNRVLALRSKPSALAFRSHCWQERSTLTLSIRSRSVTTVLDRQASLALACQLRTVY